MKNYKLLTPGPLTTSVAVKEAMNFDYCTWDDEYKGLTQDIQKKILQIAEAGSDYTAVLMQGSGTFGVESALTTLTKEDSKVLVISNGKYGERIASIIEYAKLDYTVYKEEYSKVPDPAEVDALLAEDEDITHVVMVHSETTSGILNPLEEVAEAVHKHGRLFIADAMSSFGGVPIDMKHIDALITSSNKCIQGVPGFSIIIVKKDLLENCEGNATTVSLDLYEQYKAMEKDGKWRFTSPTHTVAAFQQALEEFLEEGGVAARYERYKTNQEVLVRGMEELGFKSYIPKEHQGPIITTFLYPEKETYDFNQMYSYIKERGYVIYPGKLTEVDTFRMGNIGEVYQEDMEKVVNILKEFLEEYHA